MKALALLLVFIFTVPAAAQGLNKCRDNAGHITYTSQSCEKEGLKPAGEIKDRVTVLPAEKPKVEKKEEGTEARPPTAKVSPINPLMERLAK
jgi:hypothetical protein